MARIEIVDEENVTLIVDSELTPVSVIRELGGVRGAQMLSGDGAPLNTTGIVGDFYINKTDYMFYGPKTNLGWGNGIPLVSEELADRVDTVELDLASFQNLLDTLDTRVDTTVADIGAVEAATTATNTRIDGVELITERLDYLPDIEGQEIPAGSSLLYNRQSGKFVPGNVPTSEQIDTAQTSAQNYAQTLVNNLQVAVIDAGAIVTKTYAEAVAQIDLPVGVQLFNPTLDYVTGNRVQYQGATWEATTNLPAGIPPAGVGDGSTADRDLLLSQRSGFALQGDVTGGYSGATYTVTSTSGDKNTPGTLPYALTRTQPLWIIFAASLGASPTITLPGDMYVLPNKTIDGRGRNIRISGLPLYIQGTGDPYGTPFTRYPGYVANVIVAYVNFSMQTSVGNRDVIQLDRGFDKVWIHHCALQGGTDGLVDVAYAKGVPGRVTIDWCKFGPHPNASLLANWQAGGSVVGDNSLIDGKVALVGLDPGDGEYPNHIQVTWHHNLFRYGVQRMVKIQRSRQHMYNNYINRWALPPGNVANAADQANHPGSQISDNGSAATEVSNDGELLSENNIYEAYNNGDQHFLDPTWIITQPDLDALVTFPSSSTKPQGYTKQTGNLYLNGALANPGDRDAAKVFRGYTWAGTTSPYNRLGAERFEGQEWDWGGVPPYDYTPEVAVTALKDKINVYTGHVSTHWTKVA